MNNRLVYLDMLRAAAVLLGMLAIILHSWTGFYDWCSFIVLPVLLFISAYFSASVLRIHTFRSFFNAKWLRIGLPWLAAAVLFAPEEEVLNQIRGIVDKHMQDYPYEVTFLDVIQTGRKLWVEVYIGNQTDIIHISILHRVRDEIKQELKHKYDQVYIEVIPD